MKKIKTYIARKLKSLRLERELKRIKSYPRLESNETNIVGKPIRFLDGASFYFMYKEIFNDSIYSFQCDKASPVIIDAGANIGLASIYLKKKFPGAEIVAFEPDPKIANVLRGNLASFGFNDVAIVEKGLADFDGELQFSSEGADAGRFETSLDNKQLPSLPVTRLGPWLNREVDFLKLDIEGAEYQVMKDIAPLLFKVKKIFIEYHSFVNDPQTLHDILRILADNNFRYYLDMPGVHSKHPLKRLYVYNGMDMQVNIFGIYNG